MEMKTYADIVDGICEALGVQTSDVHAVNKIKRMVNMYYLDEVVPFKQWFWLEKTTSVIHKEYFNVGTVEVNPDSTTVTFGTAPNVSLGSFKNYRFSVEDSNSVYTIASHTAGATTATLTSEYLEEENDTAEFKIWRDLIDLPVGAKETKELWHAQRTKPMDAIGSQESRKYEARAPKEEGFPACYSTWDFNNPDDPADEIESDRFRQTRIFPSITATPVTINIDYIEEAAALSDDEDEPLMPIGDRIVLYYGAGALAWSIIGRNEEMHDKWQVKANAKLQRMAGNRDEGQDTPSLSPKTGYINSIRRSGLRRTRLGTPAPGGTSSVSIPSYLKDTTIEGANVTDDITVVDGILIDGRDISEDGDLLDSLASESTVALTDNTTNQVVLSWALTDSDVHFLEYSINRGSDVEAGRITLITDGSSASISQNYQALSDVGTELTADVSGGNLRLLATTTSTGSDATFKYREFKWLSS